MNRSTSLGNETTAMVLCGGQGTRMQPITFLMRKEMLPIGPNRRPILEYVIQHLRSYGIRNIVFLGSRGEGGDVANYFGDGLRFGVRFVYQPDHEQCRGTGHALLWALSELRLTSPRILIYYGDILNNVDLGAFLREHNAKAAAATIAVSQKYQLPAGVAHIADNGDISKFEEKPNWPGPSKIGIGLLCIDPNRVQAVCQPTPHTGEELMESRFRDIMGDILPELIKRDRVTAYETPASWLDIGSFENYGKVRDNISWITTQADEVPATERGLTGARS
ncbi:MAG: hypothetical protein ETSY2_50960, partial [Candidatus Entotheonella gemina]